MTRILIDIRRPNADGELVNVIGEIEFSPSRRHTDCSDIVVGLESSDILLNRFIFFW